MQYHTNTHGPSESGFKDGLKKSIREASANGTNQVLLVTHSLKHLQGGVYEAVLGEALVKELAKSKFVRIGSTTIYLETEKSQGSSFSNGVIFIPFVSHELLSTAMTDHRGTDVVYVPWAESELRSYVQHNPASIQI